MTGANAIPALAPALPGCLLAAGGMHSLLTMGQQVWGMGNNSYGQLGDGSTNTRRTPLQITAMADVRAFA